eukprot:NODE_4368_length_475_cov_74.291080_g3754_i0.p1 GENE.NODE_4368_length_475_cov_74.291080_g3754_i0~~NODE_4368_length_475_cov_74.291080_g3754_i0.p1  ORF type:complete len:109 (+),score=3.59 NODE_4368_length_475_cov_74.291080_g3754_i0:134-460(+)
MCTYIYIYMYMCLYINPPGPGHICRAPTTPRSTRSCGTSVVVVFEAPFALQMQTPHLPPRVWSWADTSGWDAPRARTLICTLHARLSQNMSHSCCCSCVVPCLPCTLR